MIPTLISYTYNAKMKSLNIKVSIEHKKYGTVLCQYRIKNKPNLHIHLIRSYTEDKMLSIEEYEELLFEARADQTLLEAVKELGKEIINKESIENGEAKLIAAGSLSELSLEYVVILGAKSRKVKEIIRSGTEFDQIEESNTQEHNLFIIVKYKELKDEYTMDVSYSNAHGYRIEIPTNQKNNRKKLNIRPYFDERARKGLIKKLYEKVDFLP
ncbi:hypothetical protein [Bacillus toyonensis]|uniref:hypothetical protein n=1 Tax=Bacillus toyonensis TaxID=155322 RepID=UPI002E21DDAE|nr:hypothetical protein [Bacillus toyonensis]